MTRLATVLAARPRAWGALWAATAALVALIVVRPTPPWSLLRMGPVKLQASGGPVVYYGVGRTATVLLSRVPDGWRISSNGLPEAIVHGPGMPIRHFVPRWLGSLPSWGRPGARSSGRASRDRRSPRRGGSTSPRGVRGR